MKAAPSSAKARPSTSRNKSLLSKTDAQLFLGHKVLGELRILMRLASPAVGLQNEEDTCSNGHSY